MGLFSTLNTGVTGLSVNSTGMNVIGDNIANVNTVGFKANRVAFEDLLVENVIGSAGTSRLGRGAIVAGISLNFAQGTFENSSNVTDMAINGQGFFVVRSPEGEEKLFTRDGQFYLDADGHLITSNKQVMQGYNADSAGTIGTVVEDIELNTGILPPKTTDTVAVTANLNSATDAVAVADQIDTTQAQYNYSDLNDVANYSNSITVYDSLGQPHDITIYYQKTADNTWSWLAVANTDEIDPAAVSSGDATQVASGQLVFQTDGTLDVASSSISSPGWGPFAGAAVQSISFDFSESGSLTQYGQNSGLTAITQNGYAPGYLSYLDIDQDGIITGVYSNGERQKLAQVALANFQSTAGLERRGGNMLGATADSKAPAIGAAGTGGRGAVTPFSLELSNVDLESEFVNMIASQLGYQSNSKVISTTNEMLQTLIQVV
jgi:flagellar hook protein FlgE